MTGQKALSLEAEISSVTIGAVRQMMPKALAQGQNTFSGGAAAALNAAASSPMERGVLVKALETNTDAVRVGGSGVLVGTGLRLLAGESARILVDDVNKVFVIVESGSQSVNWVAS